MNLISPLTRKLVRSEIKFIGRKRMRPIHYPTSFWLTQSFMPAALFPVNENAKLIELAVPALRASVAR